MASNKEFVDYVVEQLSLNDEVRARSMFGEYGLYCTNKFFGSVCDNRLFFKPTAAGREFIGTPTEAPPYPGAKNSFLIEEKIEDREWLAELLRLTVAELPEPKPRKKKN